MRVWHTKKFTNVFLKSLRGATRTNCKNFLMLQFKFAKIIFHFLFSSIRKYRYPHGESYLDLLQRVESVIQALLPKTDILVVSHQAVLRCIMAYFMGSKPEEVPYINVPLHTLLAVRSYGYEFKVETIPLKVECVDTYRIQPKVNIVQFNAPRSTICQNVLKSNFRNMRWSLNIWWTRFD